MRQPARFRTFCTICLLVIICSTSCKKSDNSPSSGNAANFPYTTEAVSQQKTDLSGECQTVSSSIQGMVNVNAISVLENFVNISGGSASQNAALIKPLLGIQTKNGNINNIAESVNVSKDTTLSLLFNSIKGTYTWNSTSKQFDSTKNTSGIVFIFPSKKNYTVNDAQLTITYTGVTGIYPISGYKGDIPKSFDITLTVAGTNVAEFNFNASYTSSGIPSSINGFISLTPYKLEASWTYTTTTLALSFSFLNGSNTLMQFTGNNTGDFSKTTIDSATLVQSILKTANATFQFGNLAIAGNVNYADLGPKIPVVESGNNQDSIATREARLLNTDVSLILYYVSSNQKIASIVAYPVESFNGMSTSWNVQLGFVFNDKSKGSFDSYYGNGFTNSLEKLFENITVNSTN